MIWRSWHFEVSPTFVLNNDYLLGKENLGHYNERVLVHEAMFHCSWSWLDTRYWGKNKKVIHTCAVTRTWGKLFNLCNPSLFATRWDKASNKAGRFSQVEVPGTDEVPSKCQLLVPRCVSSMTLEQLHTHYWTVFKHCPGLWASRQGGLSLEVCAVKTVPEAWSHDCKSGAPCCTASLGSYFGDEWSQWLGVRERSCGLWRILPVDHTHVTGSLRSPACEKRVELNTILPSGPIHLSKPQTFSFYSF